MGLIRITYDVVTPESAEEGDVAERGWVDEVGTEHTIASAIELLTDAGVEPSSSRFHPGVWFAQIDGDTDWETGAVTSHAYHLKDFTVREQHRIWSGVERARRRS